MYKYPAPSEARQVSAQLVIMLPRCRAGTTTMTRITGAGSDRWPCAEPCRTSRSRISDCRCHCRYHDRTTQQPMRSCRCQRTRHVSTSSPNEPSSPAFLLPQHGASLIKSPRSLAASSLSRFPLSIATFLLCAGFRSFTSSPSNRLPPASSSTDPSASRANVLG
jgi:hypothetical protein